MKNQATEYYISKIIKLTKKVTEVTLITRSHEAEYTYVSKLSIHNGSVGLLYDQPHLPLLLLQITGPYIMDRQQEKGLGLIYFRFYGSI